MPGNVRRAFQSVDTLGSGAVDRYEVKKALRQLGLDADSVQTHGVLQKYDTTGPGTLSVQQFNKLVAELQALQKSQPAPAADGECVVRLRGRHDSGPTSTTWRRMCARARPPAGSKR